MPNFVAERLAALPHLGTVELHALWEQLLKAQRPCSLRRELLVPILAQRIQEQASGSLNPESIRRLRQLARGFEADPKSKTLPVPGIKPGTRLVRQWKGQVYVVNVEEKAYEYKGSHYQSLSEIARLITGTRWSGPLFFGIKGGHANRSREAK